MFAVSRTRWITWGVLLLVALLLFLRQRATRPRSRGLAVRTVTTECDFTGGPRDRAIRLRAAADGRMWFGLDEHAEHVEAAEFRKLMNLVYGTRAERILFLDAADEISFQQFVDVVERAHNSVPALKVVVVTPKTRKGCEWLFLPAPAGTLGGEAAGRE